MPSVLIETGFLTNSTEEKFLGNTSGQSNMATLMFNAFENYRNQIENKITIKNEKKRYNARRASYINQSNIKG